LLALAAFLAISGSYGLFGTAYDSVNVVYRQETDRIQVSETFQVSVKDEYQVLYRSFAEQSCLKEEDFLLPEAFRTRNSCIMKVTSVSCARGTPYVNTQYKSSVQGYSSEGDPFDPLTGNPLNVPLSLKSKFKTNEAGCFLLAGYQGQEETITVVYDVPLAHVQKNGYQHILFSEDHFPIRHLTVQGLEGSSSASYLPKDKQLSIDVRSGASMMVGLKLSVLVLLSAIFALIPFFIWKLWGTEKKGVMVPEYLHTPPEKGLDPWKVDVLTNGTGKLSKEGMASLLLELQTAGALKVVEEGGMLSKQFLFIVSKGYEKAKVSPKAKALAAELLNYKVSEDAKFVSCRIPKMFAFKYTAFLKKYYEEGDVKEFGKQVQDRTGYVLLMAFKTICLFVVIFGLQFGMFQNVVALIALIAALVLLVGFIPNSVFGRFKDDNYRRYQEWLAFKKMLEDYAQIKQYLKEDYQMWKEWLLYATALGSAEKLLASMKELGILSAAQYEEMNGFHRVSMAYALTSFQTAHPRGSGGGGIGGGGGFGGGGGGGR
jgi:hypothetical protein